MPRRTTCAFGATSIGSVSGLGFRDQGCYFCALVMLRSVALSYSTSSTASLLIVAVCRDLAATAWTVSRSSSRSSRR